MRVDQILCAAGPVDAVTNQALAWRRVFEAWGWEGEDYAAVISPGMPPGPLRPLSRLRHPDGARMLLHYSGFASGLEAGLRHATPTLLLSHNVTPARYLWAQAPVDAARCELGRGQLAQLAGQVSALAGVSEFNARELSELTARRAEVIPILFDRGRLPPAAADPQGPPTILFVGRLAPHKRQDLVIRAFARYRRRAPDARLVLVGIPSSREYASTLRELGDALAPGAVTFETRGVSTERLAEHYRAAHAFLCLSEHEGFCIPLLEAFHFGVPVVGRDAGAIGEVIGDAGVLLGSEDSVATVAEVLRLIVEDAELRRELRARGERRLEAYDAGRTATALRATLERLDGRG